MKLTADIEPTASIEPLPPLPALKSLGALADVLPVIVTDTREQTPLVFTRLQSVAGTLTTGDYSFRGGEHRFAVERKSLADLVGCCIGENRERFERELHRLRGFWFKRLLVIGSKQQVFDGQYRSEIKPKAVLNTVLAFSVRYEVPVEWAETPEAAALSVEDWVWMSAREMVLDANRLWRGTKS